MASTLNVLDAIVLIVEMAVLREDMWVAELIDCFLLQYLI